MRHTFAFALGLLLASTGVVQAGSQTGTLSSISSVSNVCVIKSLDNISFGSYQPNSSAALQTSGQINLICTKGASAVVSPISGGSSMSGAGTALQYALYTDSAYSQKWGQTTYTFNTINFSNYQTSNYLYFNNQYTNYTQDQCSTAANGTLYNYNATGGVCRTGYTSTSTAYYANPFNSGNGLSLASGTVLVATTAGNHSTTYIPSNSTNVSGLTYSVPITVAGAGGSLSGTSVGVSQPLLMTYYAKVPAQQDVPPGSYTDTVMVQVAF